MALDRISEMIGKYVTCKLETECNGGESFVTQGIVSGMNVSYGGTDGYDITLHLHTGLPFISESLIDQLTAQTVDIGFSISPEDMARVLAKCGIAKASGSNLSCSSLID